MFSPGPAFSMQVHECFYGRRRGREQSGFTGVESSSCAARQTHLTGQRKPPPSDGVIKEHRMQGFTFRAQAITLVVAATLLAMGGTASAWDDAPFCSENYSRTGMGRVCAYYTYEQCREATSGVGGSCSANAWYQPYAPAPRRHRARKHRH